MFRHCKTDGNVLMANKREKKLSAILAVGATLLLEQRKEASQTYNKLLDIFEQRITACRDVLPTYTEKEARQIKRIVLDFGEKCFGDDLHHSGVYTSLLLAMVEDSQENIKDENVYMCFESLHSALRKMRKYWDRNDDRINDYVEADKHFNVWLGI